MQPELVAGLETGNGRDRKRGVAARHAYVDLRADERGQYYILSVSANDRPGLLYSIARVLAEHRVGVASARINTLGERVEDVFLLEGRGLSDNRLQIQVETELLRAIAV